MLAGNDLSDIAQSTAVSRSKAIIGCMLRYSDIVSQTACVLPLLGLTGENIRRAGRSIRDFVNDHPCTEQCKTIVKWAPIVAVVSIVLIACFPECMIILATPEAGAAAGSAGFLATRFPQVQAGLARLLPLFGKTPAVARVAQRVGNAPASTRATQILANQTAGNAARDAIAATHPESRTEFLVRTGELGWRRIDVLTFRGVTIESKVGYTSLTPSVQSQINKDVSLLADRLVTGLRWEFTASAVTGRIGPSPALAAELERVGIPWFLR